MKLYKALIQTFVAYKNCIEKHNVLWEEKHLEKLLSLVKNHMPEGSGFESGTKLNLDESTQEKLVFNTNYHHMSEHGYYEGWTLHKVIVKPSLIYDIDMRITGIDRKQIKDYIYEVFQQQLNSEIS